MSGVHTVMTATPVASPAPVRPRGLNLGPTPRRLLVLLLWLYSTAGPISEAITTNRAFYTEGASVVAAPPVALTYALVDNGVPLLLLAVVCVGLLFTRVDLGAAAVVSLPSVVLLTSQFLFGRDLAVSIVVPALVGVLVVVAGIRVSDLVVLGYLGGVVAAVSLVGAVTVPQNVFMSAGLAQVEKSITGAPLLAGIFSHSNILGMFLAMSLPFAFLVKRWVIQFTIVAAIGTALVLTSSRTALSGAVVILAVAVLGWLLPRAPWRVLAAGGFVVAVAALFRIPFHETDPSAYTYRGGIWMFNIERWHENELFGLGATWYRDNYADLKRYLSSAASHAHNEALTLLVQGGIVLVAAVAAIVVLAFVGAARQTRRTRGIAAMSFVLGFLVVSITETTFPILKWGPTSVVALVPLLVLAADACRRPRPTRPALGADDADDGQAKQLWTPWRR